MGRKVADVSLVDPGNEEARPEELSEMLDTEEAHDGRQGYRYPTRGERTEGR